MSRHRSDGLFIDLLISYCIFCRRSFGGRFSGRAIAGCRHSMDDHLRGLQWEAELIVWSFGVWCRFLPSPLRIVDRSGAIFYCCPVLFWNPANSVSNGRANCFSCAYKRSVYWMVYCLEVGIRARIWYRLIDYSLPIGILGRRGKGHWHWLDVILSFFSVFRVVSCSPTDWRVRWSMPAATRQIRSGCAGRLVHYLSLSLSLSPSLFLHLIIDYVLRLVLASDVRPRAYVHSVWHIERRIGRHGCQGNLPSGHPALW